MRDALKRTAWTLALWGAWAAVVAFLLATQCQCSARPAAHTARATVYVAPLSDASYPASEACARAEARLTELDCRRPDGHRLAEPRHTLSFAETCEAALAAGWPWDPVCLEAVTSCDQASCFFGSEDAGG